METRAQSQTSRRPAIGPGRHVAPNVLADETGASLLELVLVVAVIALIAWFLLDRFGGQRAETTSGPPDMVSTMDHTRQRQTMSDMKLIARANNVRLAETGRYAERISDLAAPGQRLDLDAWGRPFEYSASGSSYTIVSLGSDGKTGPAPPSAWEGSPYEPDLILENGSFTQAPRGKVSGAP